jgi:hypothetical protein
MPAVALAGALGVLYLLLDPPSADLAAHLYRADLVRHHGLLVWDNGWYGGHHLPGYSLLFPPLGALLGVRVLGALSIVAATAAFVPLARRLAPGAATASACWFAVAMAATVVSGRLPFAFGLALGTGAVLLAERDRPALAALAGAATALASPVAALFAALVAVVLRRVGGLGLAGGAVVAGGLIVGLFPEGGSEPFVASSFVPALAATLLGLLVVRGRLREGLALYALVLVGAAVVASPLGGNAARLGALLGGPLAIAVLRDRRALLAVAALPLAYWVLYPPVRDWSAASGDPARAASYYAPLLAHLPTRDTRLEIPFTKGHWDAYRVASTIPIARGWERQLDRKDNALFYDGKLTAGRYRRWLADNAIGLVALPDATLDPSARAEAGLVRGGLPYLREIWSGAHWRLYAVRGATPLGAQRFGPDWFTTTGGLVRFRWTPYWAVVAGHGCVREGPGGWTLVTPDRGSASVRVGIDFDPLRRLSDSPRCR